MTTARLYRQHYSPKVSYPRMDRLPGWMRSLWRWL